ncbi:type IX secretion system anionic LPS delivery protein PorZ [Pontibacter beigongshangensis]|uniref:type IX secretion system anionic LPS delivery protein PorZ n=1 Tax=Pontibacter beigongshangensis TaxID=2574733 RepID=UPI00164F293A|nr:two-component regulator propeller domain-containing protein [Pontibacter beigongshangensis]
MKILLPNMKVRPLQEQALYTVFLFVVLWLLSGSSTVHGQSRVAIGGWQLHVPYQQGRAVAQTPDKVYCATERGLFFYDKEFNAVQTLTKVDGLREQRISALRYDPGTETLVIAYNNTNIDLLRGNRIININDIFRKTITGEKEIYQIFIHNKMAYLSCSFGVVVLDLVRLEIRDTYSNLGPSGEMLRVNSTAVLRDSIFVASNMGVLAAKLTGTNLQDFNNWKSQSTGLPFQEAAVTLAVFNEKVVTGTRHHGLFRWHTGSWQHLPAPAFPHLGSLRAEGEYLIVSAGDGLLLLDKAWQPTVLKGPLMRNTYEALVSGDNTLWVADGSSGLVRASLAGTGAVAFAPNGPYSGNSFKMYVGNGAVYGLSGGYTESYVQRELYEGFFEYRQGEWQNYNSFLYPDTAVYPGGKDLVSAVYNPVTDKMYFGSFGNGLLEWNGLGKSKLYNGHNSTLVSANDNSNVIDKTLYVRVTDLAVDREGVVWMTNRNHQTGQPSLHALYPDGRWEAFNMPGVPDASRFDQLLLDDYGNKWLSISRRVSAQTGLYVFNSETKERRLVSKGAGAGGLPDGYIYAMAKDMDGAIWIGTAAGVAVFYNTDPRTIFSNQTFDAYIPIFERRPLLDGQTVRAIAVDGANRKWMGTDNGLWLFSPDGEELIHHFTTQNSPLPSDKVLSVAVEHSSGEVFVATDAGIASYRAGATITEGNPDCATVFPNPVERHYSGMIGISGLPNNASVRITDVAGVLVHKTQATGGTVTWDARGYNGKRVKPGVYLVMSSDRDGTQACVSKIAVLE